MSSTEHPTVDGDGANIQGSGASNADVPDQLSQRIPETTRDVPTHTKQMNAIDPNIYQHWLPILQSEWKSSQPAGTILYSGRVRPQESNNWLKYLCNMYNTWGGDLDYRAILAATGFNGGKLIWAKIPPNFDPANLTTEQMLNFDYHIIDVKILGTSDIIATDQRPVHYHYMSQSLIGDDYAAATAHGGWIVLMVLNPLVSSGPGPASVSFTIFSKPSDNFMFSQLKPPAIKQAPDVSYPSYDFDDTYLTSGVLLRCNNITVSPNSEIDNGLNFSIVDYDGHYPYKERDGHVLSNPIFCSFSGDSNIKEVSSGKYYGEVVDCNAEFVLHRKSGSISAAGIGPTGSIIETGDTITVKYGGEANGKRVYCYGVSNTTNAGTDGPSTNRGNFVNNVSFPNQIAIGPAQNFVNPKKIKSDLGESIVMFADDIDNGTPGFGCFNFLACSKDLHTKQFNSVSHGKDLYYELVSTVTKRTVMYLRLNRGGFWTTNKRANYVNVGALKNFKLVYIAPIGHLEPLPRTPSTTLAEEAERRTNDTLSKINSMFMAPMLD